MIDREIAEDPMIYPPAEIREKLFILTPHRMGTQRTLDHLWQRVWRAPEPAAHRSALRSKD